MFFMSGDSTNECDRNLLRGSSGSSILNEPADLVSVPTTCTLPVKMAAARPLPDVLARRPTLLGPDATAFRAVPPVTKTGELAETPALVAALVVPKTPSPLA